MAPAAYRDADLLNGASLSFLRCMVLGNYLDDDKIGPLLYADNRIEEYVGRKIGRIGRIISRKCSARLMLDEA